MRAGNGGELSAIFIFFNPGLKLKRTDGQANESAALFSSQVSAAACRVFLSHHDHLYPFFMRNDS